MKIRDLKQILDQQFNDDDEIAIEEDGQLYDCYAYKDEQHEVVCLVIAKE